MTQSVHGLAAVNADLDTMLALPDPEAASALNERLRLLDEVERCSYVQRGVICREFDRRLLWQYVIDPQTGKPFESFGRWMGSGAIGCRSVNYEALRDVNDLSDVPAEKLRDVPKSNVKVLKQLSGSLRKQDDVLEAARTLSADAFATKIEAEHPLQHIEATAPLRFMPTASQRADIEEAIEIAIAEGAANRNEALWAMAVEYKSSVRTEEVTA